jgi:hypothetical protein
MGGDNPVFGIMYGLVGLTLVLLIIGAVLHRRGLLTSRPAALGWAVLTILPLFGAGFAMMTKHQVEQAQGVTQSGKNYPETAGPGMDLRANPQMENANGPDADATPYPAQGLPNNTQQAR